MGKSSYSLCSGSLIHPLIYSLSIHLIDHAYFCLLTYLASTYQVIVHTGGRLSLYALSLESARKEKKEAAYEQHTC
jgi:hypothetical protein